MRELAWMAKSVQRAEWDRMVQLLSLVDCRTIFGDKTKPRPFEAWYPPGMISQAELKAAGLLKQQQSKVPSMPLSAVIDVLLPNRRKQ